MARGGPGGPEPTWNLTDQLTLFEPGWVEFALLPVPQIQKDIYTSVLSFKLLNCHCYNARIRRSIDTPMEVSQPDQLKRFVYFFGCTIERRYGDWCRPVVPRDAGVPHSVPEKYILKIEIWSDDLLYCSKLLYLYYLIYFWPHRVCTGCTVGCFSNFVVC